MISKDILHLETFLNAGSHIMQNFDINGTNFDDSDRLSNPIFKAYGYPSKIFYPSIQQYIKAYTSEGAVVLDSMCGSGTTGIAALLENRKAILIDNSPQAINLTYNTLNPIDLNSVQKTFESIRKDIGDLLNGLYLTRTSDGSTGFANAIITSNIYDCPHCSNDISLHDTATGNRSEYACKACGYIINISKKEHKERLKIRRHPVEVTIHRVNAAGGKKLETRPVTDDDLQNWAQLLQDYQVKYSDLWAPADKVVYNRCYPRVGGWPGFQIDASVSDLFPERNLVALKILYDYISNSILDDDLRSFFLFVFTECLFRSSKRLFTTSGIKNVYHVPPVGKEQNVLAVFERKYKTICKAKQFFQDQVRESAQYRNIRIHQGNSKLLPLDDNTIDYAFIDPPYGGVVPYAELNLFYSAWLQEKEDFQNEIIIPMDYDKKLEYARLWGSEIEHAFKEVFRVLKPGAFFTIVFQSKHVNIWNELRDVMSIRLGFKFVHIIDNQRSTTFHTNHLNDTNPQSAFITYRKPLVGYASANSDRTAGDSKAVFQLYPLEHLINYRPFRDIQSKIISLVHQHHLETIPTDNEIRHWLLLLCREENNHFVLKEVSNAGAQFTNT